jgi:hypothetical protein
MEVQYKGIENNKGISREDRGSLLGTLMSVWSSLLFVLLTTNLNNLRDRLPRLDLSRNAMIE